MSNNSAQQLAEKAQLLRAHLKWFTVNMTDAFKMHPLEQEVLDGTLAIWLDLSSSCSVEPFMKWFYASMFSHITHQALPPFPGAAASVSCVDNEPIENAALRMCLGTSVLKRFLRSFLHARRQALEPGTKAPRRLRREALSAASTIANMKKGSPVPSTLAVFQTREKYEKSMKSKTTVRVQPFGRVPGWKTDPNEGVDDAILESIRDVVREVFRGRTFRGKTAMPSISGHFDSGRKASGAASVIKPLLSMRIGAFLDAMFYHPHCGVIERRGEAYHPLHEAVTRKLLTDPSFDCKPSFLLEPLKVRTVTAGPALEYYACMSAQDFMWKTLSQHPTFVLIGRPVDDLVLNDYLVTKMRPHLEKEEAQARWLSGDYSAATDNLRQALSRAAWNEVCAMCGIPAWLRRLGSKALVGHKIHFKPEKGLPKTVIEQWNGQLMGSPLSFPILCLVNAALCGLAFRHGDWSEGATKFRDMPLLVNGDDCVMHFTPKQKLLWERYSACAGLAPSIGKCYYSSRFLQINSTNFIWEKSKEEAVGRLVQVPYWNFSLCSQVKSKGAEDRHWSDLGSSAREFVKGFSDDEKKHMMSVFIRRQKPLLAKAPPGMSYWLPECLGGLGLPYHCDLPMKIGRAPSRDGPKLYTSVSHRQAKLATWLRGKIEAGEAPMRRMRAIKIPKWVQTGMAKAAKLEVRGKEKSDERKELMDEWGFKTRLGGYGPSLWRALAEATDEDMKVGDAEELTNFKGWFKVWKASAACTFIRPLEELLSYVPPRYGIPGNLTEVLGRVEPTIPVGLVKGVSTLVEFYRDVSRSDLGLHGRCTLKDIFTGVPAAGLIPDQDRAGYTNFARSGSREPSEGALRYLARTRWWDLPLPDSDEVPGSLRKTPGCTCEACIC